MVLHSMKIPPPLYTQIFFSLSKSKGSYHQVKQLCSAKGANQRLATFCRQMFVNLTKDSGEIIAGVFIALSLLNEH